MSLTDQLKGYWKLNAAGLLVDATGLNPNLTNNNGVTNVAGKVGEAAQFVAASSQSLSTPSSANLQTGDIDFTLAFWVQLADTSAIYPLVAKWAGAPEFEIRYAGAAWQMLVYDGSGVGVVSNVTVPPDAGVWHFLVCWHDSAANTLNLQVDNTTVETAAWTTGVAAGAGPLQLGFDGVATYHNGRLDEVLFAKRVYTTDERTQLWNNGNGITYPFATLTSQTGPGGPVEGMLLSSYERTATTTVEGFRNA